MQPQQKKIPPYQITIEYHYRNHSSRTFSHLHTDRTPTTSHNLLQPRKTKSHINFRTIRYDLYFSTVAVTIIWKYRSPPRPRWYKREMGRSRGPSPGAEASWGASAATGATGWSCFVTSPKGPASNFDSCLTTATITPDLRRPSPWRAVSRRVNITF